MRIGERSILRRGYRALKAVVLWTMMIVGVSLIARRIGIWPSEERVRLPIPGPTQSSK